MDGSACVSFTWGRDGTRMHCRKKARWWRQCDALGSVLLGNPGSSEVMWMFTRVTYLKWYVSVLQTKLHPFMATGISRMAVPSFSRIMRPVTLQRNVQECSVLDPINHLWDVPHLQFPSMEAPPRNLQDLKDLLLTSWCQIPQDTFRGLVEFMPRRLRAVLAARGGPTQY